ncbi:Zinc finger CCCH domain-containing protein 32 [Linum grandiflorum]
MEPYGHSKQLTEWTPAGPETGLHESMRGLGLSSNEPYPERPGFPNCVYYMRTGVCGYGGRCRYNHPPDRAAIEATVRATGLYPERNGDPPCQGEDECSYYLQTGHCKFGITCKFHHPERANTLTTTSAPQFYQPVQSPSAHVTDQYGGASTNLRVKLPGTFMQGTYGPVLFSPIPGWSPFSAPVSPVLSPGAQTTSLYGVTQLSATTSPAPPRPYPSLLSSGFLTHKEHNSFPQRPGEPECQYYLKTGNCKYGSFCRYHHPQDRVAETVLNPLGLPLRLGMQPCSFYLQTGHCKFGSSCKFDHPIGGGAMRYSPSSVAPYLVGSLLATLSPPSTSYELRPQLFSGLPPRKITYLSRSPPGPGHTSNSPVGLIFSQTGPRSPY